MCYAYNQWYDILCATLYTKRLSGKYYPLLLRQFIHTSVQDTLNWLPASAVVYHQQTITIHNLKKLIITQYM